MRRTLTWALSLAQEAGDDDDLLLRKRVAVIAGYVTIGAALSLPFLGDWSTLTLVGAFSGLPGRIHVAPSTWMLLREHETFEARQPMEIKGLGLMATYLVA